MGKFERDVSKYFGNLLKSKGFDEKLDNKGNLKGMYRREIDGVIQKIFIYHEKGNLLTPNEVVLSVSLNFFGVYSEKPDRYSREFCYGNSRIYEEPSLGFKGKAELEEESKALLDGPFIERGQIRYFCFDLKKYTDIFPIIYQMLERDFFPKLDEVLDEFLIRTHWHEQLIQTFDELIENYEKRWRFPETIDEMVIQFKEIISETNKEDYEKGKEAILMMSAIYTEYIFLHYSEEGSYSEERSYSGMDKPDYFDVFNKVSKNFKATRISVIGKIYYFYRSGLYENLFDSPNYCQDEDGKRVIEANTFYSDSLN